MSSKSTTLLGYAIESAIMNKADDEEILSVLMSQAADNYDMAIKMCCTELDNVDGVSRMNKARITELLFIELIKQFRKIK